MITAKIPVKLVNGANSREHYMARHSRAKDQRWAARAALMKYRVLPLLENIDHGITITITRRGGRRMDDDGLTISAKHVRDGVADWLGIDDGDPRLTWVVKQDKAPRGQHWVDVEVVA
jgi:DNA-binding GntR family transcriptional regulator